MNIILVIQIKMVCEPMIKLVNYLLIISSFIFLSNANAAREETWTVGAGGGWAHAFDHKINDVYHIWNTDFYRDLDKNGYGLKVYGERNFKTWFSLGLGYNYINGQHIGFKCTSCGIKESYHTQIAELYGRFAYPFDEQGSDVFFKIGPTYNWFSFLGETHSNWGGVAGVGAQYAFNKNWSVRGGYDYFYKAGKIPEQAFTNGDIRIDEGLLYVTVQYTFGEPSPKAPVKSAASNKVTQLHTMNADILFPFDSYKLSVEGKKAVSTVMQSASDLENPEFEVYGYTDRMGSDTYNQTLSQNRADAVSEEFANNGVTVKKAEGKGKNPSVTGNKCDAVKGRINVIKCLQPDRRVEVLVSGQKVTK